VGKRFHVHMDIDYAQRMSDRELAATFECSCASELRARLVCLKAAGALLLVTTDCDNHSNDGRCLGHEILEPPATS